MVLLAVIYKFYFILYFFPEATLELKQRFESDAEISG